MSSKTNTAGIILAAGASVRFGQPKQLIKLRGKYLIERVLDAALKSRLDLVVLVLGHEYQSILQALGAKVSHPQLEVVINHKYQEGQSSSLKAGLVTVQKAFSSVMYLLADQPMINSNTIDLLLDQIHGSRREVCVPVFEGRRGNPTIFKRSIYEEIMMIDGDIGARNIIAKNAERVLYAKIKDPLCFFDIDSPEDLKKLQGLMP
jgi:molybdenum cofactor cytidylyltransferase